MTLVEAVVATALFAVLAAAVSGLWLTALRTTAAAERAAARAAALEPYTLPLALLHGPPPACGPAVDGAEETPAAPCLRATERCRAASGALACDGSGELARIELRLPGPSSADSLVAWTRVPP